MTQARLQAKMARGCYDVRQGRKYEEEQEEHILGRCVVCVCVYILGRSTRVQKNAGYRASRAVKVYSQAPYISLSNTYKLTHMPLFQTHPQY